MHENRKGRRWRRGGGGGGREGEINSFEVQ